MVQRHVILISTTMSTQSVKVYMVSVFASIRLQTANKPSDHMSEGRRLPGLHHSFFHQVPASGQSPIVSRQRASPQPVVLKIRTS